METRKRPTYREIIQAAKRKTTQEWLETPQETIKATLQAIDAYLKSNCGEQNRWRKRYETAIQRASRQTPPAWATIAFLVRLQNRHLNGLRLQERQLRVLRSVVVSAQIVQSHEPDEG